MPSDSAAYSSPMGEGPYLTFLVKPVNKIRFRYQSEKGSHGVLIGSHGKKTFPTVKLENYNGSKAVIIKASLFTADQEIPHVLDLVGKDCQNGVCYRKLDKNNTAQFSTLSILSKKKEDVQKILLERKRLNCSTAQEKHKLTKKFEKVVQKEAKEMNLNSVCLCFEAYYEDDKLQKRLCEKLFSDRIDNQKSTQLGDLRICRLSKSSGSCKGGEDMILLCDKIKKEDIKVRFYEVDDADNVIWEAYGDFKIANVHYQVAIPFRTPPYKENVEKTVFIQLVRKSNGDKSEGVNFAYIPDENDIGDLPRKKKKFNPCQEIALPASSVLSMSVAANENNSPFSDSSQEFYLSSMSGQEDNEFFPDLLSSYLFSGSQQSHLEDINLLQNEDFTSSEGLNFPFNFGSESSDTTDHLTNTDLELLNPGWMLNETVENQSLVTDGLPDLMDNLSISSKPTQRIDNTDVIKKEQRKLLKHCISLLLKDMNVMHYYTANLIIFQDRIANSNSHFVAQENKNLKLIQKVLDHSPFVVNKRNKCKETLLHISTRHNKPDVIKILLKYGGNPNLQNKDGNNCIHIAAANNFTECLEVILSAYSSQGNGKPILDLNALNYEGLAPIHIALRNMSVECISILLKNTSNVNIKEGKTGRTILHLAIELYPSLVPNILKQPGIIINASDFGGNTPYDIAVQNNLQDIAKLLMAADEDDDEQVSINHENFESNIPLTSESCSAYHAFSDEDFLHDSNDYKRFLSNSQELQLCERLDTQDERWRDLGQSMGFDDSALNTIAKLDYEKSPTKTLLNYLERKHENKCSFLMELKVLLEILQLQDAVTLT